jgi:hypothetical protein
MSLILEYKQFAVIERKDRVRKSWQLGLSR